MRSVLLLVAAVAAHAQPAGFEADRPYARIYAPTAAALQDAIEEVSFAALQFERAFGQAPPPITVVVADDPAALTGLEAEDGRPLLPFWTRRGLQDGTPSADLVAGALLREVDGAVRVVGRASGAESPFVSGDVVRKVDGTPVAGLEGWRRAYGAARASAVAVTVERAGAPVVLEVEGGAAPVRAVRRPASSASTAPLQRPLSHEACHSFLGAYARERGAKRPGSERAVFSGVPALPDWLDEAVATWCETPSLTRGRDAILALRPDDLIPLDRLLTTEHPLVASGLLDDLEDESGGERGPVRISATGPARAAIEETGPFYAQSSSLLRFLAARHGPLVVGRLVDRMLGGAPAAAALQAEGVDPTALEAEWRGWVAATVPGASGTGTP